LCRCPATCGLHPSASLPPADSSLCGCKPSDGHLVCTRPRRYRPRIAAPADANRNRAQCTVTARGHARCPAEYRRLAVCTRPRRYRPPLVTVAGASRIRTAYAQHGLHPSASLPPADSSVYGCKPNRAQRTPTAAEMVRTAARSRVMKASTWRTAGARPRGARSRAHVADRLGPGDRAPHRYLLPVLAMGTSGQLVPRCAAAVAGCTATSPSCSRLPQIETSSS
jgi:hypothetical protein